MDKKAVLAVALAAVVLLSVGYAEDWWDYTWSYRVPITLSAQEDPVENPYVKVKLDFDEILAQLKLEGTVTKESLRLLKLNAEQPIDVEGDYPDYAVSWVAKGTIDKTPQQFLLYFDLEENGEKDEGRRITREIGWLSGYSKGLSVESPEWRESWAKLAKVSLRWCTDSLNDKAYLIYGQNQLKQLKGRDSNITTLQSGSVRASFESPTASGAFCNDEKGKYGIAIDFIQFFPVAEFELNAPVYSSIGKPEFFIPSPSSESAASPISISNYTAEVGVEMGWTKDYELIVRNDGGNPATNTYVAFSGIPTTWYQVLTPPSTISPGYEKRFSIRLSPPVISRSRTYPLTLQAFSKDYVDQKPVNLQVFTLQSELLRYEIEKVNAKIDQVEAEADKQDLAGMNVTPVKSRIDDARLALDQASTLLDNQLYAQVSEYSLRAEEIATEAEQGMSFVQPKQKSLLETIFTYLLLFSAIAFIATFLIFFRRTNKAYTSVRAFERSLSVAELKKEIQGKDASVEDLRDEKERVERFLMGVGNQHRQGLLSDEAYQELRSNAESKLKAINEMLGGR